MSKTRGRVAISTIEGAPSPLGAYSHAVWAGDLLFVAGQGARNAQTGLEEGVILNEAGEELSYDIEVQTRAVLENLKKVLKESGCSLQDLVDVSVFLKDIADFPKYNQIYRQYFSFADPPARTTVEVSSLPGKNHIELKAIAYKQR